MKVLVRGAGNIGTTVAALLATHRALLDIDEVALHKGTPLPYCEPELALLAEAGVTIFRGEAALEEALAGASYLFDCRAAGAPRRALSRYAERPELLGASAQGTEHGFGLPFVHGINDPCIRGARFVQIASCNTHATSTLLATLCPDTSKLEDGDFVVVRRSEDIGHHERLVGATVVARHRHPQYGTHHAEDAARVFTTLGVQNLPLTSSDATTPSQVMHSVRFRLRRRGGFDEESVRQRIQQRNTLATTEKFDSNRVFELGRRFGAQGRLYNHAIVVANNLLFGPQTVSGWAFVPQEGNTILSTLMAFVHQMERLDGELIGNNLRTALLRDVW